MIQVRVVCTDKGTHPSRELATLYWSPAPTPEHVEAMQDGGMTPDEIGAVLRNDSLGTLTVKRRRGDVSPQAPVDLGWTEGGHRDVGDVGDGQGTLWRFSCPTCPLDQPMRHDRLVGIVDRLVAAGRVSLDLSALPPTLA